MSKAQIGILIFNKDNDQSPADADSFFRQQFDEKKRPLSAYGPLACTCVCVCDSMECSVGRLIKAMTGRRLKMERASPSR